MGYVRSVTPFSQECQGHTCNMVNSWGCPVQGGSRKTERGVVEGYKDDQGFEGTQPMRGDWESCTCLVWQKRRRYDSTFNC